jgi:hypothetical protein
MFNFVILFFWALTPFLIFYKSRYQALFLFSTLPISVFDSPFNVNFYYFTYFGLLYFLINSYNKINIYLLYILFYNTFITFLFYIFNFGETDKLFFQIAYDYFVSQVKLIALFGIYYYLYDNKVSINFFLRYFLPALVISILIGYIIYFGIDTPFYLLKQFGYTFGESTELSIIRLSGLTQEPRYLAYLIVFGFFMLSYANLNFTKIFLLRSFFLLSIILTKSFSGFLLLFFNFAYDFYIKFTFLKFSISVFLISFILYFYIKFFSGNFFDIIYLRIIDRYIIQFDYLPYFFSIFEHHDTIALKFLEQNLLVTIFGMGYGQIKNYEAIYGVFIDPSMTLFNFNSTIHCCDPQSLIINIISSFGILNLFLFIFIYFKKISFYNQLIIFIFFNFLNNPPGPLPLFIFIFAIYITANNIKLSK